MQCITTLHIHPLMQEVFFFFHENEIKVVKICDSTNLNGPDALYFAFIERII